MGAVVEYFFHDFLAVSKFYVIHIMPLCVNIIIIIIIQTLKILNFHLHKHMSTEFQMNIFTVFFKKTLAYIPVAFLKTYSVIKKLILKSRTN